MSLFTLLIDSAILVLFAVFFAVFVFTSSLFFQVQSASL